jgi:redox-sensitive bicupin YhaK (pirin superfamily)
MLGVQLWLNIPRKDKMTAPKYRDIEADMVPKITENGCTVGIISGYYKDTAGAVQGDYIKTLFLDVELQPGSDWKLNTNPDETLFIYIVEGEGWFEETDNNLQPEKRAILFNCGDEFIARASQKGLRFFLLSAKPLKEPIFWGGPIVMNTRAELEQAFSEIRDGTFIKSHQ